MSEYMLPVIMCTKKQGLKNFLEHAQTGKIRLLLGQSGSEPFGDSTISVYENFLLKVFIFSFPSFSSFEDLSRFRTLIISSGWLIDD